MWFFLTENSWCLVFGLVGKTVSYGRVGWRIALLLSYCTLAQIKDPEEVTNKMYGCNIDTVSRSFFPDL